MDVEQQRKLPAVVALRHHDDPLDLGAVPARPAREAPPAERDLLSDPGVRIGQLRSGGPVGRAGPHVRRRVEVLLNVGHHRAVARKRRRGQGPDRIRHARHRARAHVEPEQVVVGALQAAEEDRRAVRGPDEVADVAVELLRDHPGAARLDVHHPQLVEAELPLAVAGRLVREPAPVRSPREPTLRSAVVGQRAGLAGLEVEEVDLGEVLLVATVLRARGVHDAPAVGSDRKGADPVLRLREPRLLAGLDVEAPQVAPLPGCLPVRPLVHEDRVGALLALLLLLLGARVLGDEEDGRAVLRPLVRPDGRVVLAELHRLAAVRAHDEELRLLVDRAREGQAGPVRREAEIAPPLLPEEAIGLLAAVGRHLPPRRLALVLVPLELGLREEHPRAVGRDERPAHLHHVERVVGGHRPLLLTLQRCGDEGDGQGREQRSGVGAGEPAHGSLRWADVKSPSSRGRPVRTRGCHPPRAR